MENEVLKNLHKICDSGVGTVYASDDVFTTVVGMTVFEVDGVAALADVSTGEAQSRMGVKNLARCMRFDFEENTLTVTLSLILTFGCNLPEVCSKVQNKVISAVCDMIGYEVRRVNIGIADVKMK